MIPITKALEIVERETKPLVTESIDLAHSIGRVLAEAITADMDLPPFDRSQMDGYAVIAADTVKAPVSLTVVGESAAGKGWRGRLKKGEAVWIMTGAPVPVGADAVQKVELTSEKEEVVSILEPVKKDTAIVRQGSEITRGTTILKAGEVVTENMIAVLASFGYAKVRVGKNPRISILGTGSEIVEVTKKPGRYQIRNSNSIMLDVLSRKFGGETKVLPNVGDDIAQLKKVIRSASKTSDVLIITGGVSVGKYDHTKTALADLGADIFFEKVRLKPGKPIVFARLNKTLIFGLPGNPVSAAVTFHIFVRGSILKMQDAASTSLLSGRAVMGTDVKANRERDTYLPSRLETNKLGQLVAFPLKWQGSSDFVGYSRADSLIFLPKGSVRKKGEVGDIAYL
ncbi:molybdopterin molybdotransferase MoeA [soil metagenome]